MTVTTGSPLRILLLGGTTEATALATHLARVDGVQATLSLAGRTANPAASAFSVRIGGFGGVEGLANHLQREKIDLLVDATHPFAARISANAIAASIETGVPLLAVERPPWTQVDGDDWIEHDGIEAAISALPHKPQDVFSGLGRQAIDALRRAPHHRYLIRVVDPIELPANLAHAKIITARGPFHTEDDIKIFTEHRIRYVLAKNAGGSAAYSKIEAARKLGITVHMVRRPALGPRPTVATSDEALNWIEALHRTRSDLGV
ncbi:cobalt-precorrin-6A reductase [Hyphomicrobium sp.]|uniref:cobalt-precorrin-6A reductase n=1 Tax=Hyphomicrobium sp. TaxID=82 RepID=UPI003565AC34